MKLASIFRLNERFAPSVSVTPSSLLITSALYPFLLSVSFKNSYVPKFVFLFRFNTGGFFVNNTPSLIVTRVINLFQNKYKNKNSNSTPNNIQLEFVDMLYSFFTQLIPSIIKQGIYKITLNNKFKNEYSPGDILFINFIIRSKLFNTPNVISPIIVNVSNVPDTKPAIVTFEPT